MIMKSFLAVASAVKPVVKWVIDPITGARVLEKPIFDTTKWFGMEKAQHFFDQMDEFGNALGTIGNYIGHPILIFNAISGVSYWICLAIGFGGLIFYICGNKKALKYTGGSLLGFSIIKMIDAGLKLI